MKEPCNGDTQLSNSGEVHFPYEVIHDIHGQVSSSLFRRRRSSKETLLCFITSQKRFPIFSPQKTTEKEMRTLLFPVFAFGCYILTVAYASPDVTDVVQKVGSQCYIVALPIK